MENEHDRSPYKPKKLVAYDVVKPKPAPYPNPRRSHRNKQGSSQALEIQPVMEAVKEYARRTHSLGALAGARALEQLAEKIRALPPTPELADIGAAAEASANDLKSFLSRAYDD
jgi:hypothetical protein